MSEPPKNIADLLAWEDKGIGPSPMGVRHVFTAMPTEYFWKLWRRNKVWFQTRGVFAVCRADEEAKASLMNGRDGMLPKQGMIKTPKTFEIRWYKEIPDTPDNRARREASRNHGSDFRFPVPAGVIPHPYQRAGVEFMIQHADDAVLLADEMGLGKTPQSIWVCNILRPTTVLIVCPASLLRNWEREWKAFSTLTHLKVHRVEGDGDFPKRPNVVIVSMDATHRPWLYPKLHGIEWDAVLVDEAHKLQTESTLRARAIFGGGGIKTAAEHPSIRTKLKILITGTPITSRVEQSWNLLRWLWPHSFGNRAMFENDFCGASGKGKMRDTRGESNLDRLQARLRSCGMIRRLKKDVLKELPPKIRQVIELPGKMDMELNRATMEFTVAQESLDELRARRDLAEASGDEDALKVAAGKLKEARQISIDAMSRVRRMEAERMIPMAVAHVKDCIEGGSTKIIVGAHHKCLVEGLMSGLEKFHPVKLTGSCSLKDRDAAVQAFQKDPKCQVIVASILAAGVGLTLTASSHTILAEADWVPANVIQFEDRNHRIGQEADSVLYQYLVIEGSLGAKMINTCVRKLEIYKAALDTEHPEPGEEPLTVLDEILPEAPQEKDMRERGKELTWDQTDAIHGALKQLARADGDRASTINGEGFSRYDSTIGHSLAEAPRLSWAQAALGLRLVIKYRKQINPEIYARATEEKEASSDEG